MWSYIIWVRDVCVEFMSQLQVFNLYWSKYRQKQTIKLTLRHCECFPSTQWSRTTSRDPNSRLISNSCRIRVTDPKLSESLTLVISMLRCENQLTNLLNTLAIFLQTTKLSVAPAAEATRRSEPPLSSAVGAADSLTAGGTTTPGWRMACGRKRAPLSGRIILQQPIQTGQIFIELYWI